MDGFGGVIFFGFLAAIIIVPQVLRNQERQRLHDTIRASLAKGQPVPPELFQALRWRRRVYTTDYDYYPQAGHAPPPPPAAPPGYGADMAAAAASPAVEPPLQPAADYAAGPMYVGRSLVERDLRRGVVWLAIGVGLIAAGAAFYAGLYNDGGAPEVFSSFAALGAIPVFVGLTYLALWRFNRKTRV